MIAAGAALAIANSPFAGSYFHALHIEVVGLSIQHWINDALMAVFFLLVGLEIKREFLGSSRPGPGASFPAWRRPAA